MISKYSRVIGLWSHDTRAKNAYIRGTSGRSNGTNFGFRIYHAYAANLQCNSSLHSDHCAALGTHILITHGIVAIEHLQPGDKVIGTIPNK